MEWSREQEGALRAVQQWFRSGGHEPFYLAGYAGTGKTTLARHFASSVGGEVKFGAFTGKAASVLRKKGCPGATTIHSLIYKPVGNSNGKKISELESLIENMVALPEEQQDQALLRSWGQELQALKAKSSAMFEVNEEAEITEADLVILDECSMLDDKVAADLLAFNKPVLVLGDPFQLPPIGESAGYFTNSIKYPEGSPDILLTEIHRQAAGSPIIQLATKIRNGEYIATGDYGDVVVTTEPMLDRLPTLGYEQIICGTNRMRNDMNARVRTHLQYRDFHPQPQERLVCLRNDSKAGVLNGEVYTVVSSRDYKREQQTYQVDVVDPIGRKMSVTAWDEALKGDTLKSIPFKKRMWHMEFAYGYAITCHKAQGSQYQSVAVVDESRMFREHSARWLYTAVTRAQKKLLIAR